MYQKVFAHLDITSIYTCGPANDKTVSMDIGMLSHILAK